jgi:predicted O-linked N-acetylglucosamine transferase (SPINDLY family)
VRLVWSATGLSDRFRPAFLGCFFPRGRNSTLREFKAFPLTNVASPLESALRSHQAGHLDEAEAAYRKILRSDPGNVDALHLLGALAHQTGRNVEAIELIGRAISRNGLQAIFHNSLGAALRATGRLAEALAAFECALRLDPNYVDAHNNLGAVLHALGYPAEAQEHFLEALRIKPDFAEAFNNLGNVVRDLGHLDDARACFERALRLKPDFAEALNNIAGILHDQDRLAEAAALYEQALRVQPDCAIAWNNYGNLLRDEGKWSEALRCFDRALELRPHDGLKIKAALVTPVIVESAEAIRHHRDRIQQNVARLLNEELSVDDPVTGVGLTSLYLAYHGCNDRELQSGIAAIYSRATSSLNATVPQRPPELAATHSGRPLRVGFISRHFHNHSNARLNVGLMRALSRQHFRVVLLHFPGHDDAYSAYVQESADEVVTLPLYLDAARRQIVEQQLDVLFYTDIGMEPLTYFLAFARLAHVQCTTWGVPVTTGIPAIDYFISSDDLEPPGAQQHYTEHLVRLQNLPTYYYAPHPAANPKTRAALGLDESAHLYVCPQSLFKIHPEFDSLLGQILGADPAGQVLLLSGQHAHWTELVAARLRHSISEVVTRVRFLPRLSSDDFLQLLAAADVLLDPLHFGGGNTTFEALALGTPIVTWPGEFMRGRVTYACYRKLGVLDCVAADWNEYVKIAVRLASDRDWCDDVRSRILAANHVLFENTGAVRELEQFFIEAVSAAHSLRKCG